MAYPDLCALADVTGYLPGYSSVAAIDTKLSGLITAQSVEIIERTGRELVPISPAQDPRVFYATDQVSNARRLQIGDASAVTSVVQARFGTNIHTYTMGTDAILMPNVKQAWEPYTSIWFPWLSSNPAIFFVEDTFTVTGTWGFPSIPSDVKEACAKLVIVRYVTDIAKAGTEFADAITDDINIGGLFVSATSVIERYSKPWLV